MKRGILVVILLSFFLIVPIVSAETYSGFNRFTDNIKLFFSSGDNKVMLALEVREKEVNSAVINTKNGNAEEAEENLERAWKRLQLVQEKVSINTAEEVKENSNEIREKIMNQENLPNDFDVYVLEEEKTGLTAEWVIEVGGKEGQNSENWVVNGTIGEGGVVVNGTVGGNRVWEIETRIGEIDGEISNWVVDNDVGVEKDNGLTWEVKTELANGDNGLKPEVKTYMDVVKNNVIDKSPMTKDNEDVSPAPNIMDGGMCKEGEENCNNDVAPGPQGIVGVVGPDDDIIHEDDGENVVEDSSNDVTGEVVKNSDNFIKRLFSWLF
ncbi:MAG: hypothetical protein KKH88_03745 [Nanoarchaeota archaeon]|nr:hypothetical protein [Nanoarchaeota archaeon]